METYSLSKSKETVVKLVKYGFLITHIVNYKIYEMRGKLEGIYRNIEEYGKYVSGIDKYLPYYASTF